MELWIGTAKKTSKCHSCDEPIPHGTPVMQGKTKKRKGKPWPPVLRWHPACWYESALKYLTDTKPERVQIVRSLGRPKMQLDEESRKARYLLVRRFNTFLYRRNQVEAELMASEELPEGKLDQYRRLTENMLRVSQEIESVGGIPSNWPRILNQGI